MNDVKKISTRDAYGHALVELGNKYPDMVVLDACVSGGTRTAWFKKAFPKRHFNCGIAEANMMCVAAGLASTGRPVFASAFAVFAAGRAYEQIRTSIGYTGLPVKIGATHAGVSIGSDGATHQCVEDIALMRSIPGMTVLSPADAVETEKAMEAVMKLHGPVYLRLSKMRSGVLYDDDYKFEIGIGDQLMWGKDVTVISTGLMVEESMKAAEQLKNENISVRVVNMATIKPIDRKIIISAAVETGAIVTVEEHSVFGGLADAVAHVVNETIPVPLIRVGVDDMFGQSGSPDELLSFYGLCAENICVKVKEVIRLKCMK